MYAVGLYIYNNFNEQWSDGLLPEEIENKIKHADPVQNEPNDTNTQAVDTEEGGTEEVVDATNPPPEIIPNSTTSGAPQQPQYQIYR